MLDNSSISSSQITFFPKNFHNFFQKISCCGVLFLAVDIIRSFFVNFVKKFKNATGRLFFDQSDYCKSLKVNTEFNNKLCYILKPFVPNVPFLYPPKNIQKTVRFSDVFRGYRKGALRTNRLNITSA